MRRDPAGTRERVSNLATQAQRGDPRKAHAAFPGAAPFLFPAQHCRGPP